MLIGQGGPKYIIIVLDMLFDLDKHKFIFYFVTKNREKNQIGNYFTFVF